MPWVAASDNNGALRVFVGTSPGGQDAEACAALEASVRRRSSVPLDVRYLTTEHEQGWDASAWSTPWTALRWAVPELCGFEGIAVYFDCPSIVLADVTELAAAALLIPRRTMMLARREGRNLLTSCIVFDCAEAEKYLKPISAMRTDPGAHYAVGALLDRRQSLVAPLPGGWGYSDMEAAKDPPAAASVHFGSPYMQPHLAHADRRLAREGRKHWFDEVRLPHYSDKLVAMWEAEYAEGRGVQEGGDE